MAKANPFFDTDATRFADFGKLPDYTKLLADFRFPGLDVDAWMGVQKRNFEALTAANQLAVQCAQSVAQRQAELLRQTMDEARRATTEMIASGSPEEKAARQAELAREAVMLATAGMRELAELVTKSNNEAFELISKRVVDSLAEVKSALAKKPSQPA